MSCTEFYRGALLALLTFCTSQGALAEWRPYDYVGKGTWQPNLDLREVIILMHFTKQQPVPCGPHKRARACAHLPKPRAGARFQGHECTIGVVPITSAPTDEQLRQWGRAFFPCLQRMGYTYIVRRMDLPGNSSHFTMVGKRTTKRDWEPCTISIAPMPTILTADYAQTLGHEVLHCFRGSWHEDEQQQAAP